MRGIPHAPLSAQHSNTKGGNSEDHFATSCGELAFASLPSLPLSLLSSGFSSPIHIRPISNVTWVKGLPSGRFSSGVKLLLQSTCRFHCQLMASSSHHRPAWGEPAQRAICHGNLVWAKPPRVCCSTCANKSARAHTTLSVHAHNTSWTYACRCCPLNCPPITLVTHAYTPVKTNNSR